MERRDVLKAGITLGAGLVLADLAGGLEAEAGAGPKFYEGPVTGGPLNGGIIRVGILGTTFGGFVSDGFSALHIRGTIRKKRITAQMFDLNDITFTTPLGTLTGTLKGKSITGTHLVGSESGTFSALLTVLDARVGKLLQRTYNVTGRDDGANTLFTFTMAIRKGGAFTISSVDIAGSSLPAGSNPNVRGWIGVRKEDGNKLVHIVEGFAECGIAPILYATLALFVFISGSAVGGFMVRPELASGVFIQLVPASA